MAGFALFGAMMLGGKVQGERLPDLPPTAAGPYHLGPGDEIRVTVAGLAAPENTYRVDDTGVVALPMLAPLPVAGKTLREAEGAVADQLRARHIVLDPSVSMQVQTYRPFFISGEVQRPGQYAFMPGMTLATAVSMAGGYTFRANTKSAVVTRASVRNRAAPDARIDPGDMIQVRERWF